MPKFSCKNNFITDPPWYFKRKYMKDYEVLWHYTDGDISGSVDGDLSWRLSGLWNRRKVF